MEIKKTEIIDGGVLINEFIFIPHTSTSSRAKEYKKWLAEGNESEPMDIKPDNSKLSEITRLESKVTPRRYRDAILTGDNSFIEDIESQIQAIRDLM